MGHIFNLRILNKWILGFRLYHDVSQIVKYGSLIIPKVIIDGNA
jgi:hypothetical protein